MDINEIRKKCMEHAIEWTQHSAKRLLQRGITAREVDSVILSGDIIEDYPEDSPFPSGLVFGLTEIGRPLHVVCAIGDNKLWVVTAYEPDLYEWLPDYKTRKD